MDYGQTLLMLASGSVLVAAFGLYLVWRERPRD